MIGEVHRLAKNSQPDSGGAWTGYWGDKEMRQKTVLLLKFLIVYKRSCSLV